MSFEEEFDDIIRQKSDELNFPFEEKNWDKASAMINAQRKAAGPGNLKKLLIPALALLFIGSAVIVGINYAAPALQSEKNNTIALNEAKNTTEISPSPSSSTAGSTVKAGNTSAKQPAENPVTENNPAPVQNISSSKDISTGPGTDDSPTNNSVKRSIAQPETAVAPLQKATNTVPGNEQENLNTPVLPAKNSNAKTPTLENNNVDAGSPVAQDQNTKNNAPQDNIVMNDRTAVQNNNLPAPLATNNSSANKPGNAETNNNTPGNTIAEPAIEQLPLMPVFQPGAPEQEVTGTPLVYMKRYDEDYYKNGAKPKLHFANVEFGGTYMLGWDTKAGRDGKGMDWFGGFNYGVYITKKISISAGLQAYSIQHIDEAFYTNKKVEYDFGSIASNTVITSNNLYYAAIPVKIYYAINKENQFGVGANFGYMLNSSNTVETYDILDNAKINYKSVKNNGVYTGANSMNIMLGASYRYEVKPRLYLTGEFVYGISDIFKNTRTIKNNEHPSGIRLSLQYTLFDK